MTIYKTASQANCDVSALGLKHKDALYRFILKRVRDEDLAKVGKRRQFINTYSSGKGRNISRKIL